MSKNIVRTCCTNNHREIVTAEASGYVQPTSCACGLGIPCENASLAAQGYRVVSRRHRTVAKVDRDDWHIFLVSKNPGMVINAKNQGCLEDFYRRVYSKDTLVVNDIRGIPNSGHSRTMPDISNLHIIWRRL